MQYTQTTKMFVTSLMCPRREASHGHFGKKAVETMSELVLSQRSGKSRLLFYGRHRHHASLLTDVFLAKQQLRISRAKTTKDRLNLVMDETPCRREPYRGSHSTRTAQLLKNCSVAKQRCLRHTFEQECGGPQPIFPTVQPLNCLARKPCNGSS